MTTTMISNLPKDLMEDIINRLSMKSLKAVRLTCKSWNHISQSESFKKMHIGKLTSKGESMMIVVQRHSIYLMSGVVDVDPCIDLKGKISFLNNQVSIGAKQGGSTSDILTFHKDISIILSDTRLRNLVVARFVDYFHREPEEQFFWYEMYDFDSGLWTTLDVAPHWGIYCSSSSVSLKGNSYWCAAERSAEGFTDRIICFDFTKERFGPLLPLPSCVRDRKYVYVNLSSVKEEKIAALFHHHYGYEFEIWITTKIEVETVSWSKFLRIDTRLRINSPDCFFINEEKKVFMCVGRNYGYDSYSDECPKTLIKIIGEAGYSKLLDLEVPAYKNSWLISVCSYVPTPSLVQIKKLARGKRIKQSILEKRQFDQNMLRLAEIEKLMKDPYRHRYR